MRVLLAEYASALGLGGTCELEGRAMLSTLVYSFQRAGHEVIYPMGGTGIGAGRPIPISCSEEFETVLRSSGADAGLLIAPDHLQPNLIRLLEGSTVNLGCSPDSAELCADKLRCTRLLQRSGVPVAEIVDVPDLTCRRYVAKPRFGCGSEGVRITSSALARSGEVVTRYCEGLSLSASFIVGERFLPLTINRQILHLEGSSIAYQGSQVPYRTPRAAEVWEAAERAAEVLGLRGYAGIDLVLGASPRVVDVNARPTTSIIGIARVMREELADLILRARFGGMPDRVTVTGEHIFSKEDLVPYSRSTISDPAYLR